MVREIWGVEKPSVTKISDHRPALVEQYVRDKQIDMDGNKLLCCCAAV
jgi:hypothetical protein